MHLTTQVWRARLVAGTAAVAWALAMPTACSNGEGSCVPPAFQVHAEPEELAAHCALAVAAECRRAFASCPELGSYTFDFADVASCEAEAPGVFCNVERWSSSYLVDDAGAACLEAIAEVGCPELEQEGGPKACWGVELPVPPDPSRCRIVAGGSHRGTLDTPVARAWSSYAGL